MNLTERRGIEFCIDPAWRVKVGYTALAMANAQGIELSDDVTPGIVSAVQEFEKRIDRMICKVRPA